VIIFRTAINPPKNQTTPKPIPHPKSSFDPERVCFHVFYASFPDNSIENLFSENCH